MGMDCAAGLALVDGDCDFDLERLGLPTGTLVRQVCPASCEACSRAEGGDGETAATRPVHEYPATESDGWRDVGFLAVGGAAGCCVGWCLARWGKNTTRYKAYTQMPMEQDAKE